MGSTGARRGWGWLPAVALVLAAPVRAEWEGARTWALTLDAAAPPATFTVVLAAEGLQGRAAVREDPEGAGPATITPLPVLGDKLIEGAAPVRLTLQPGTTVSVLLEGSCRWARLEGSYRLGDGSGLCHGTFTWPLEAGPGAGKIQVRSAGAGTCRLERPDPDGNGAVFRYSLRRSAGAGADSSASPEAGAGAGRDAKAGPGAGAGPGRPSPAAETKAAPAGLAQADASPWQEVVGATMDRLLASFRGTLVQQLLEAKKLDDLRARQEKTLAEIQAVAAGRHGPMGALAVAPAARGALQATETWITDKFNFLYGCHLRTVSCTAAVTQFIDEVLVAEASLKGNPASRAGRLLDGRGDYWRTLEARWRQTERLVHQNYLRMYERRYPEDGGGLSRLDALVEQWAATGPAKSARTAAGRGTKPAARPRRARTWAGPAAESKAQVAPVAESTTQGTPASESKAQATAAAESKAQPAPDPEREAQVRERLRQEAAAAQAAAEAEAQARREALEFKARLRELRRIVLAERAAAPEGDAGAEAGPVVEAADRTLRTTWHPLAGKERDSLAPAVREALERCAAVLETHGPADGHGSLVKPITGIDRLFELRPRGEARALRVLFVFEGRWVRILKVTEDAMKGKSEFHTACQTALKRLADGQESKAWR